MKIKAYKQLITHPTLEMVVFHEDIYKGRELMKVVGIRANSIELNGDYSGGTNPSNNSEWFPLKGTFQLVKLCDEIAKSGTCTLHNLHCGSPKCESILTSWGYYVNGELTDEVELI